MISNSFLFSLLSYYFISVIGAVNKFFLDCKRTFNEIKRKDMNKKLQIEKDNKQEGGIITKNNSNPLKFSQAKISFFRDFFNIFIFYPSQKVNHMYVIVSQVASLIMNISLVDSINNLDKYRLQTCLIILRVYLFSLLFCIMPKSICWFLLFINMITIPCKRYNILVLPPYPAKQQGNYRIIGSLML